MEQKVYLIDLNQFDHDIDDTDIDTWTNERWVEESERQGLVYTLSGFQYAFNTDIISSYSCYMRIINT